MNALAHKVFICSTHHIPHTRIILRHFRHELFIEDLLGENLLHYAITVVHLGYLRHHLIGFRARVDFRDLSREEYATQILICWWCRCLRKPFLNSLLTIVREVIWSVLFRLVTALVEIISMLTGLPSSER